MCDLRRTSLISNLVSGFVRDSGAVDIHECSACILDSSNPVIALSCSVRLELEFSAVILYHQDPVFVIHVADGYLVYGIWLEWKEIVLSGRIF